jgi:hypothetical protein
MPSVTRQRAYHYRLTEEAEDALLAKKEARKMLADKALCAAHNISRSTLRQALQRALARRKATLGEVASQTPEQKVSE